MGTHTNAGWKWNFIWRRPLFDNEINMADNFLRDIKGNLVQPHTRDDWVWKADPNGQYSAQSAYNLRMGESTYENQDGVFDELWKLKISSKTCFFVWRIIRDRLPTKINLRRRHVEINDVLCPFCMNNEEDAVHLFFQCSKILPLWWESLSWVGAFPQNPRQHFLQHAHGQDDGIMGNR